MGPSILLVDCICLQAAALSHPRHTHTLAKVKVDIIPTQSNRSWLCIVWLQIFSFTVLCVGECAGVCANRPSTI